MSYIKDAIRTESPVSVSLCGRMIESMREVHSLFGLMTEVGELVDAYKRYIFYGKGNIDRINVIEELGDILWYFGPICDELGITLEEIQERNIAKLKARYPDKFSTDNALNRNLVNERNELEK